MLEGRLVLDAVVSGEAADQVVAAPFLQDSAEVLACDARHGGEVALAHLVADEGAARPDLLAERTGEAEQRPRRAGSHRGGAHGEVKAVIAQAPRQQVGDVTVELGMGLAERVERRAADEIELRRP